MNRRISVLNFVVAFLLSVIAIFSLAISQFALPIEMVMFNSRSYSEPIENEEFTNQFPKIISNVVVSQIYDVQKTGVLPEVLSERENFETTLASFIPLEGSKTAISAFVNQVIDSLNFRIPFSSMNIDMDALKSGLILNSRVISEEYILTLPNCSAIDREGLKQDANVFDLASCKPGQAQMSDYINLTSKYLEDIFNQLPSRFSITSIITATGEPFERGFYTYSIGRWALRMMPFLTIALLILIAILLKQQRSFMLKWVGRLLVFVSGFLMILLVVVMIGFGQVVSWAVSRISGNLVEGFDVVLMRFANEVGYRTLLWTGVSTAATFLFGFFLLLMAKIFKPKIDKIEQESPGQGLLSEETTLEEDVIPEKDTMPQTMEEIEEEEKKDRKAN